VDEIKLRSTAYSKTGLNQQQNFALRRDAASHNSLDNIIGSSRAMEKLKQTGAYRRFPPPEHRSDSR